MEIAGFDQAAIDSTKKSMEEEIREREGDYGRIPIILSPRNTKLIAGGCRTAR